MNRTVAIIVLCVLVLAFISSFADQQYARSRQDNGYREQRELRKVEQRLAGVDTRNVDSGK